VALAVLADEAASASREQQPRDQRRRLFLHRRDGVRVTAKTSAHLAGASKWLAFRMK